MNLITEIKDIVTRIDHYAETNYESNELISLVKILNGKIDLLKKEIKNGHIQDEFEKKFDELKGIQYGLHHQMLFGPLSRILGLIDLIEREVESGRTKELNKLTHLLTKETHNLKNQVMKILEGTDNMEKGGKNASS